MECEIKNKDTVESWFMRLVHTFMTVTYKQFQELGLHPGQLPLLRAVANQEGLSQRELADLLHIKPPTVTVTLQRLERSGIMKREADPKDQRISRIYLTQAGKELSAQIDTLVKENHNTIIQGFTQLKQYLERMYSNMDVLRQSLEDTN